MSLGQVALALDGKADTPSRRRTKASKRTVPGARAPSRLDKELEKAGQPSWPGTSGLDEEF